MTFSEDIVSVLRKNTLAEIVVEDVACSVQLVHRIMCNALAGMGEYSIDRILYIDVDHRFDPHLLKSLHDSRYDNNNDENSSFLGTQAFFDMLDEKLIVSHPPSHNDIWTVLECIFSSENSESPSKDKKKLRYMVLIDSILSIPHLPFYSESPQYPESPPTLGPLFRVLLDLSMHRDCSIFCITNVFAARRTSFIPYRTRHEQIYENERRFGRFLRQSEETDSAKSSSCHMYNMEKYPRQYRIEDNQYIYRRMFVRYWHEENNGMAEIHPKSDILDVFTGTSVGFDDNDSKTAFTTECPLVAVPEHEAEELRDTFTTHLPMRIFQCPWMPNEITPIPRSVEERCQENYNALMILNSRAKQRSLGSKETAESSSTNGEYDFESHVFFAEEKRSSMGDHKTICPFFHTSNEMLQLIGAYDHTKL